VAVPHADLDALERAIQDGVAGGARRVWYCADGVYSMFGDRLDVAGLATLMARYPTLHAYLDDAHGMSWCGRRGLSPHGCTRGARSLPPRPAHA
jgi:7-keto-8-aminopelargonate synthetase-like enzyme